MKNNKSFSPTGKSILAGIFIGVFITCLACKYSNLFQTQTTTTNVSFSENLLNNPEKYIIKRIPKSIASIDDVELRKRVFIRILTPAAMVALSEVRKERNALINILKKMNGQKITDASLDSIDKDERVFLWAIVKKYRSNDPSELLKRIDEVPLNLILAQAAIESNWGTSRFAIEGNNLFGIWTYRHQGIKPKKSRPGDNHKVARYPSILDSVRDYIYNLNVGWAYKDFREARTKTKDAVELASYLSKYSEKGELYIKLVKALSRKLNKQYAASYVNLFN